jgi:hypothetical protein
MKNVVVGCIIEDVKTTVDAACMEMGTVTEDGS